MCSITHFQLAVCSSCDCYHTIQAQLHCYFYYFYSLMMNYRILNISKGLHTSKKPLKSIKTNTKYYLFTLLLIFKKYARLYSPYRGNSFIFHHDIMCLCVYLIKLTPLFSIPKSVCVIAGIWCCYLCTIVMSR